MGFQDGAGTSWDLPLIRVLGREVYLCLSHTLSLPGERGTVVSWLGWGPGARHGGVGRGLDGPFFLRPQPSPGVKRLVGSKGPAAPWIAPGGPASQSGGSQGPLLPRELLCGLGGQHVRGGASLSPPPCSRGEENGPGFWLDPGVSPGPHFPSQGLAGYSAPLGTLAKSRLRQRCVLESSLV